MEIQDLQYLREGHAGFRLFRSQHFAFTASLFWKRFVRANQRALDEVTLLEAIEDHLYQSPHEVCPQTPARDILKHWVEAQYLRQYYSERDDVARYELTVSIEKALDWVYSLRPRSFVGTESRLRTIYELLLQIREQTEKDTQMRVNLLMAERQKITDEIDRVLRGELSFLTDVQVKERFAQLGDMARQLLRDFTEVEQNFRQLDRQVRRRIAQLDGHKSTVLESVFRESDIIKESEQGRSFQAFFEFLLSPGRQEEMETLLNHVYSLEAIRMGEPDLFLSSVQSRLIDATDKVQSTQNQLAAQLRRFLDDRQRLQNTRISQLIDRIEQGLLNSDFAEATDSAWSYLDEQAPHIEIPTRSLYRIPLKFEADTAVEVADHQKVSAAALFSLDVIDERQLLLRIRRCLDITDPVSLKEVLDHYPLEKGIAELVTYIKLALRDPHGTVSSDSTFDLIITSRHGERKVAVPHTWFSR